MEINAASRNYKDTDSSLKLKGKIEKGRRSNSSDEFEMKISANGFLFFLDFFNQFFILGRSTHLCQIGIVAKNLDIGKSVS